MFDNRQSAGQLFTKVCWMTACWAGQRAHTSEEAHTCSTSSLYSPLPIPEAVGVSASGCAAPSCARMRSLAMLMLTQRLRTRSTSGGQPRWSQVLPGPGARPGPAAAIL